MDDGIEILLLPAGAGHPGLDQRLLTGHGYRLVPPPLSLFPEHRFFTDIAAAIAVLPEVQEPKTFFREKLPEQLPILALDHTEDDGWDHDHFPGPVIFSSPSPTTREISRHLRSLIDIRQLQLKLAEQEQKNHHISSKLQRHLQSVKDHSRYIDQLTRRDPLTGLRNRRELGTLLPREFNRCLENGYDLSLLIIDLDYFNVINRSAGSSFGDFVLNDFAARLTAEVHPRGTCFRFSGEIFLVLLSETSLETARDIAISLRRQLQAKPFVRLPEKRHLTFSAGLVSLAEHQPEDADTLVTMAEKALFVAKSEGRDRIVCYQPLPQPATGGSEQNLLFLKQTLNQILNKTRTSAIDSLQLLARDLAGAANGLHIRAVRQYVELLGRYLELPTSIIQTFKNAITLHTSIRFLLHNEMISKQDSFTSDDREIMDDFPFKLAEITEMFEYFSNERAVLLYHGERYDGTGYPEGLKGDEIPLGARIFSIVDALAAMEADRPHRKRLDPGEIITELAKGAGRQFDPALVVKMLELIKNQNLFDLAGDLIDQAIADIRQSYPDATI